MNITDIRLYALLTERFCRLHWQRTAEALLAGGVDAVQLREKDLSDRELLVRSCTLRKQTEAAGALLIVNDRPDVAVLAGADGVHLGQDDLPPAEARRIVGPDLLIGWSTHSARQAAQARDLPLDYIGVGPFAPTATKGYEVGFGADLVRAERAATPLPMVAIGGITADNAADAIEAGATAVAVCAALCDTDDPEAAARRLRAAVVAATERREGRQP
ncbi:MAG: thiamine phosphate synthase [Candidatus Brocadiaceae bacterium]|nr:thiamine phosphate synthase [Candidatus Brocadiaceae bacterium]